VLPNEKCLRDGCWSQSLGWKRQFQASSIMARRVPDQSNADTAGAEIAKFTTIHLFITASDADLPAKGGMNLR
jgi:hypothetical protein